LCQVAVTLTYATGRGHTLIGRVLYLPEACAADKLTGISAEVMFASKPQLAHGLLDRSHSRGIRSAFVTGDKAHSRSLAVSNSQAFRGRGRQPARGELDGRPAASTGAESDAD
jgi:hypothetical protein